MSDFNTLSTKYSSGIMVLAVTFISPNNLNDVSDKICLHIDKLNDDLNRDESALELQILQLKLLKGSLKPIYIFRSSLNIIMNHLYDMNEKVLKNLDYSTLFTPYKIKNNGDKFIVAFFNGYIQIESENNISYNICKLHLSFNNICNLKKKSLNEIYGSIKDIKYLLNNELIPDLYKNINLSVIDEYEKIINTYRYLF